MNTQTFILDHEITIRPTCHGIVDLVIDGFRFGGGHLNEKGAQRHLESGINDGSIPRTLANLKRWQNED